MSDLTRRPFSRLRMLSNVIAAVLLLFAIDAVTAWWRGTRSVTCASIHGFGSDAAQLTVGMTGLLLAMFGIMLGGMRHGLTAFGVLLLLAGLLGGALAPLVAGSWCE